MSEIFVSGRPAVTASANNCNTEENQQEDGQS